MNDVFTGGLTPEEAVQLQTLLDETVIEMKRIREAMDCSQHEIEASQARTDVILKDIRLMMDNRWRR